MATAEDFTVRSITDNSTVHYEYDYDYSDQFCNKTNIVEFGAVFTPVLFCIVVVLSLFGNILVIVILAKFENLKSLTNAFILNLAVSDLLFTAGLPFWAYSHIYGWTLGEIACKTVNFIFYIGFYSSGILLILMTAHRYVAVMNPLSNIVSTTGIFSVVVSVIIWAVSILVASPAVLFTTVQNNYYCTYANSHFTLWGFYQQNVLFIISSMVFIFCYSQIICRLMRPTAQRRKNKTLKLIFTLMVVFFVGWAPYNIVIFLRSFSFWSPHEHIDEEDFSKECEYSKSLDYAMYVTRLLAFSHCCLNPVFYVFVGVKFKTHLKKMLKTWGHSNASVRSRQSRLTITSQTSGEEFSM